MAKRLSLKPSPSGLSSTPWRANLPANISSTGKRERRFFKTKAEAETFCQQQRTRLENFGRNASTLTPGQLEQAAKAFERLAPLGVSLNDVVTEYLQRHDAKAKSVTFKEMFDQFTASKKARSAAYLTGLRYTLPRFTGLHDVLACSVTPAQIDDAMAEMTAASRNAFMRNLRAAFNFGIKRDWLTVNPIVKLEFSDVKRGEVTTLTPSEAARLMAAAAETDPELIPFHALGLFAGIRPMELERLEWKNLNLGERHIEIPASVSKTGRRRIIEMEPNLHAWLTGYIEDGGRTEGSVTPATNLRKRLRDVRTAAGIAEWEQDVARHSYASYWLALHGSIDRLTQNLGHTSPTMLWRHYHRASKKADAVAYSKIMPATDRARKVVSMAA